MVTIHEMLKEMTATYTKKSTEMIELTVQFKLLPEDEVWFLRSKPGEQLKITESCQEESQIIFSFSEETLFAIYLGKMTGLTAMGRENISDQTPLDFALGKNINMTPDLLEKLLVFVQRFFNPTYPEKVVLDKSLARLVHGGWKNPMFYHSGFRSA